MLHSLLIADDNPRIRQALSNLFTRESDFTVCGQAENGKEAVEKAEELHPDLILLDLSMPVMNGLDAARILGRMMPEVPIIMFTAFADQFIATETLPDGVTALVSKSEDSSVLIGRARSLM
jgi:DNA-binding NarL/FixJ family response regulator